MKLTEKMEEFMNNLIGERMEQVYQEKDGRKYDVFNEELEFAHQNVLRKLPKEQKKILFDYATEVANRCSAVTLPIKMTPDEVKKLSADTSKGEYNDAENMWYFYDATYEITNNAKFTMPKAA